MQTTIMNLSIVAAIVIGILIQCEPTSARPFERRENSNRLEKIHKFIDGAYKVFTETSHPQLDAIIQDLETCAGDHADSLENAAENAYHQVFGRRSHESKSTDLLKRLFQDLDDKRRFQRRDHSENLDKLIDYLLSVAEELPDNVLATLTQAVQKAANAGPEQRQKVIDYVAELASSCASENKN